MHADQLVPAVVSAVAVVCLLIAGRADGLEEYAPTKAVSSQEDVEPLIINQNPGQFLPRPEVMPVPGNLFGRPDAGGEGDDGEYVPMSQVEIVPEVVMQPGAALGGSIGGGDGGAYGAVLPITDLEAESPTSEDEDVFYGTGESEAPAKAFSPDNKYGRRFR